MPDKRTAKGLSFGFVFPIVFITAAIVFFTWWVYHSDREKVFVGTEIQTQERYLVVHSDSPIIAVAFDSGEFEVSGEREYGPCQNMAVPSGWNESLYCQFGPTVVDNGGLNLRATDLGRVGSVTIHLSSASLITAVKPASWLFSHIYLIPIVGLGYLLGGFFLSSSGLRGLPYL